MLFATIGIATPVSVIVVLSFTYGFFQSPQFTSMNTLVYADVSAEATAGASTIASTAQQLSMSFGVATASLVAALFVPDLRRAEAHRWQRGEPAPCRSGACRGVGRRLVTTNLQPRACT